MIHTLIAFASALLIVAYWIICRRRSLVHRERAADLLVAYFNKKGVSESDKDAAAFFYRFATWWAFMPIMTLLAFPIILARMLSKRPKADEDKDSTQITDAIMKMYLFRNPITGTICLMGFSIMTVVGILLGLMINRLRVVPTPSVVYMATAAKVYNHPPRRHAH